MQDQTFLVTGAMGCIGAWVLRNLVREGIRTIAFDLADDPSRPSFRFEEGWLIATEVPGLGCTVEL